jgi:hypothetical protein
MSYTTGGIVKGIGVMVILYSVTTLNVSSELRECVHARMVKSYRRAFMSDKPKDSASKVGRHVPEVDEAGRPVEVVRKDIEQESQRKSSGVDKVITPTATRVKEQDAQAINEAASDAEQKMKR